MRYLRLKSLTWWSGLVAIVLGGAAMIRPEYGPNDDMRLLITTLLGGSDSSPVGLILLGTGLIGLGDKLERAKVARAEGQQ